MMRYDAVFFDLDGTILDTLQDIVNAVNHSMRRFHLPECSRDTLRSMLGYGVEPLMKSLLPDLSDAERSRILADYRPYYTAHAGDLSRPFKGIPEAIERLRGLGLDLAVLSNKPDAALQPLVRRYFADWICYAVGERPGVRPKPNPDMLITCAEALGLRLDRCLYVGDTEIDIETARNAGTDCLCVSWGFRDRDALLRAGARRVIDEPEQLLPFVEGA